MFQRFHGNRSLDIPNVSVAKENQNPFRLTGKKLLFRNGFDVKIARLTPVYARIDRLYQKNRRRTLVCQLVIIVVRPIMKRFQRRVASHNRHDAGIVITL